MILKVLFAYFLFTSGEYFSHFQLTFHHNVVCTRRDNDCLQRAKDGKTIENFSKLSSRGRRRTNKYEIRDERVHAARTFSRRRVLNSQCMREIKK